MNSIHSKYAELLTHYCLEIKAGDRLYIRASTLAEPLVREVYRSALRAGALVEVDLEFQGQRRILLEEGNDMQLQYVPPLMRQAFETFDAYLHIRAPFNLREDQQVPAKQAATRSQALHVIQNIYFQRAATRALRRNLCEYPTQASAQEAGMSLEAYEHFIYNACKLFDDNPAQSWLEVRHNQQRIVDFLNKKSHIRYWCDGTDITFSTQGRTWINSDGQTNMPSGEVYTAPVEDSVNGVVHFSFPAIYMGYEVEGVTLWVQNGYIERWEARRGQEILDQVFSMDGARRFGEAAIGTNYNITCFTKNILFDEKIGGTVHLAVGQSYPQAGGKNQSAVHWDMIADMRENSAIFADGEKIYENGQFLI